MAEETTVTAPGSAGAEATAGAVPSGSGSSGSAGYEVPGEPGVYWCARHKKVKTRLRCGRCERPICPKCTVYGPTGARCRDCASNRGSHLYQISPPHYAAAIVTALALGLLSGFIASVASFFALFYAPVAGTLIGKAVSAVTKHKRGTPLAVIASAGLIIGALVFIVPEILVALALSQVSASAAVPGLALTGLSSPVFLIIYLVLAVPSAWWWLK